MNLRTRRVSRFRLRWRSWMPIRSIYRRKHNILTVKGERKPVPLEGGTWYQRNIEEGTFGCLFHIPDHVDHEQSTAFIQARSIDDLFPEKGKGTLASHHA